MKLSEDIKGFEVIKAKYHKLPAELRVLSEAELLKKLSSQGYNGPNLPTRSLLSISLKSWVLSESRTTIASGVVGNPHNQPWVK